ncbi:MAG: glycosyltransferase [Halomonas sp.]|uniref:glycosyltransferase n=1 Tax=Halomonas sp. TaxID=1486246 RepID=UPI002ACE3824|nr:glycosyltransferase [Halomonas sp.]MDZ7851754.1 glycosyltransferase [Halomonas sp.]
MLVFSLTRRPFCASGAASASPCCQALASHRAEEPRVAAVQNFNGSDFSLPVPIPGQLYEAIEAFEPDIVHSHHPFLLGDTACRAAETYGLPLVFTHHTLYEHYTHYVPGDSPRMQRFATSLAAQYTWLCDAVIVPSESIGQLLLEREGNPAISVVPSGVATARFAQGNRRNWRERLGINQQSYVIGHVGRLAQEKNLAFLAEAVSRALHDCPAAHFLVVGEGEAQPSMASVAKSLICGTGPGTSPARYLLPARGQEI